MSINLGICKDESVSSSYNLKCVCTSSGTKLIITKDDIEVFSYPCVINKNIYNFEVCKKSIHANSYDYFNLNGLPMVYFFKPEFNSLSSFEEKILKIVFNEDVLKVNQNLENTPEETLILESVNSLKTQSYNPSLLIPRLFNEEQVLITIKDSNNNILSYSFNSSNYKLGLSNLLGNKSYEIELVYLEKNGNTILSTETRIYTLFVTKKKLATYENKVLEVLVTNTSISKLDIDNDITFIVKNVSQNISFNYVNVNITNVSGSIQDIALKENNGTYDLEIKYRIFGNLAPNELYDVTISGLVDVLTNEIFQNRTLQFATNVFHSCVKRTYVSDIFMNITNIPFNNDKIYMLNETQYDMDVNLLIGYYDESVESILNTIC